MHAIKVGWAGQTFALAKCNESDSGGRKSRIRRSKEERKVMVESFIKRYQKLNNGNFPSLNLTHKEVGGSFYTVREIVREIIQENKVLGPAKFLLDKLNVDQFVDQNPLGSIATEPQIGITLPSNEPHLQDRHEEMMVEERKIVNGIRVDATNEVFLEQSSLGSLACEPQNVISLPPGEVDQQVNSEELESSSPENSNGHKELKVGDGIIVNGGQVDTSEVETDVLATKQLQVNNESVEAVTDLNEYTASTSKVINLTGVEVETFPMKSVSKAFVSAGQSVGEGRNLSGDLPEERIVEGHWESNGDDAGSYDINTQETSFINEDVMAASAAPLLGQKPLSVDVEVVEDFSHGSLKSLNGSTPKENDVHNKVGGLADDDSTTEQPQDIAQLEAQNAPSGVDAQSTNGSYARTGDGMSSQRAVVNPETSLQSTGCIRKGSNPTLDRMNLGSWEGASKNPSKTGSNPLLVILRAFIASFVKFWSE